MLTGSVDILLGATAYIPFDSWNATLVPTAPDSTPTGTLYTGPNLAAATAMGASVTVTAITGLTGRYVASWAATAANGFAAGTMYHLRLAWVISSTTREVWVPIRIG